MNTTPTEEEIETAFDNAAHLDEVAAQMHRAWNELDAAQAAGGHSPLSEDTPTVHAGLIAYREASQASRAAFAHAERLRAHAVAVNRLARVSDTLNSAQQMLMSVACQPSDVLCEQLRANLRAEAIRAVNVLR